MYGACCNRQDSKTALKIYAAISTFPLKSPPLECEYDGIDISWMIKLLSIDINLIKTEVILDRPDLIKEVF